MIFKASDNFAFSHLRVKIIRSRVESGLLQLTCCLLLFRMHAERFLNRLGLMIATSSWLQKILGLEI